MVSPDLSTIGSFLLKNPYKSSVLSVKGQWTDLCLVLDGHLRHLENPLPLVRDLSI